MNIQNLNFDKENDVLKPGVGFALIRSILRLNNITGGKRKTEVIILSRNNADTSLRVFNNPVHHIYLGLFKVSS